MAKAHPAPSLKQSYCNFAHLERLASQSVDWLTSKLNDFSPLRNGRAEPFYLKAFAELTLVYVHLQQCKQPHLRDRLLIWRGFITGHCENPIYAQGPRKQPIIAFTYLMPYLLLRSIGYRSAYYEETLDQLRRRDYLRSMELVPYRVLDREYMLWKSGYSLSKPPWRKLYHATALGQGLGPLCFDDEATYSLTHTLFYLTDFGDSRGPFSSAEFQWIGSVAECLLLHYWRVGHWDLVGELLVALNCLGSCSSLIYTRAAAAFESTWQIDGSIPAKREFAGQVEATKKLQKEEPKVQFCNCYHTTLVGVLYCATAIGRISGAGGDEACPT